MYTGMVNGRRFFVGASDRADAVVKVRQAHALVHGQAAASVLMVTEVVPYRHIWWGPK